MNDLSQVFRDEYHFHVDSCKIPKGQRAQKHINAGVSNFVMKYDSPDTLLVVYYAGHGQTNGEEFNMAG